MRYLLPLTLGLLAQGVGISNLNIPSGTQAVTIIEANVTYNKDADTKNWKLIRYRENDKEVFTVDLQGNIKYADGRAPEKATEAFWILMARSYTWVCYPPSAEVSK